MKKDLNNYKPVNPQGSTCEEKINMMKIMLSDSDKCKEIARKICAYISEKN